MQIMRNDDDMKSKRLKFDYKIAVCARVMLCTCFLFSIAMAGQTKPAAPATPKAFDSPQLAAEALITAAGAYDVPQLMTIFGPDGKDFVESADPVEDKNNSVAFATEARAKNSIS